MALTKVPSSMLVLPLDTGEGTAVASAGTVNLDTATGNFLHISGTTTITAVTLTQGAIRYVVFDGILTLTHSANLLLPGAANITTAAGDIAIFAGEGAGVTRCISYTRASGTAVVSPSQYVKAFWRGNPNTGTAAKNLGFSGVSVISTGVYQFTFSPAMANSSYIVLASIQTTSGGEIYTWPSNQLTSSFRINVKSGGTGSGGAGFSFANSSFTDVACMVISN